MELKINNGNFKVSIEEILKLFEGIKSIFIKKENSMQNNDYIQLQKFTRFSNDEFGIEDID